ncbi:hypothetical protein ACWIG5_27745 [Streptomyces lydicus]
MTTMHRDDDQGQNFPRVQIEGDSVSELLAQAERELGYRRNEFVAARKEFRVQQRRVRRDRRRELRKRTAHVAGATLPPTLALIGTVAFTVAVILLAMGNVSVAKDFLAVSAAAWGGVAAFRRPPRD